MNDKKYKGQKIKKGKKANAMFEDTKRVIRIRKLKNDSQHTGRQRKKDKQ
jgi:hypothetical protein